MKYVFGPVTSRRLGRSLGIDPIPLKTCNFSCIYCQLGRTRPLTRKRKAFFSVSAMLAEVATTLDRYGTDSIDWITFVGSGETTLNSRLGALIRFVKSISRLPIAVITNGSLLYLPEVRKELVAADAVLPSLDAGSAALYARINRPHRDFPFDQHVAGLIEFSKIFAGKLWIEVMLVGGVNDSVEALTDIADIMKQIGPDEIHLSTPTRPPAEQWVELPGQESLERASSVFEGVAKVLRPVAVDPDSGVDAEIADAVLTIVSRHPLDEDEVVKALARWVPGRVYETLADLAESGMVRVVERYGKRFWCAARSQFPDHSDVADRTPRQGGTRSTARRPA